MNPFEERRASAKEIRDSVASGSIETASRATLTKYGTWLCTPLAQGEMAVGGEHAQVSELVRFHMLRTLMEEMEKRNSLTQCIVIVLAVAALVVAIPQIWFAYKADKRAEIAERTEQARTLELQSQASAPIPALPRTTGQGALPASRGKSAAQKKPAS